MQKRIFKLSKKSQTGYMGTLKFFGGTSRKKFQLVMFDKQMKGVRLTAAGGVFKELLLAVTKAYSKQEA